MKPRVYVETSVISYLAARRSRDLVVAAHQQITHEWWERRAMDFDLVISGYVVAEAAAGDFDAAQRRLALIAHLPELAAVPEIEALGDLLCLRGGLPAKAQIDARHVAAAAVFGIEYLVTWNCTHIANMETLPLIESICRDSGYEPPRICTPLELSGYEGE